MKVPEKCLICDADWSGGHQHPSKPMEEGLRVFYDCGASMSYMITANCYKILINNCCNGKEKK